MSTTRTIGVLTHDDDNDQAAHEAYKRHEQSEILMDRVQLLKLRTALVGIAGFLLLTVTLAALIEFFPYALAAIKHLWASDSRVHVPGQLFVNLDSTSRMPWILPLTFLAVAALGVSAMSRDAMTALQRKLWLVLMVLLGSGAVWTQLSADGNRTAQAQLEAALKKQDWSRSAMLLGGVNTMSAHYVRAQIALAQGDAPGAREQGLKLMPAVDQLLMSPPDISRPTLYFRDMRPAVLQRIDLATYGAAHSEVSIALAQGYGAPETSIWVSAIELGLALLASALGLVCAGLTLGLWYRMVQRVRAVRLWTSVAI